MLEINKPKLEEATEEEIKNADNKIAFPIAGVVIISVLVILIIACIIVINVLEA